MCSAGNPEFAVVSPEQAVTMLRERLAPLGSERVPLGAGLGRVLARALTADRDSPSLDVSVMDGFALSVADARKGGRLPIVSDAAIGRAPIEMPRGVCARIVTGAPLPRGADCVIKREDVIEREREIEFRPGVVDPLRPGFNIRKRGENARAGDVVVEAGTVISAPALAALAGFGHDPIDVHRRVRVGVLVTGDELVKPGAMPEAWQLRDSDGPAAVGLLAAARFLDTVTCRFVEDDPDEILAGAAALLESCDALLLTGGVSMGDRDFVPRVLRDLGVEIVFHRVPQRPGRPVLGGVGPRGQAILGLPGNPVSVLVTTRRMAIPILKQLAGASQQPAAPRIVLSNPDDRTLPLWWHRLVRLVPEGVELVDNRGSGDIVGAARSDGFVEIPPGASGPGPWPFYSWGV